MEASGERRRRLADAIPSARLPPVVVEIGAMFALAGRTIALAVQPPFSYAPELVTQFRFVLYRAWFPLVLTAFAISFGPFGVQAGGFLGLFGALDRLGGLYELVVVREFAPFVTAIIVAGVAGTAICADLGARKVREELDALAVLGVDVVKSIVVPRFLALLLIAVLFNIIALLAGLAGAVLVEIQGHQPLGPFFASFFAAANPTELFAAYLKCLLYGGTIAIVCCYKGMSVSGGPEGVGRAVNQAVVMSFLMIGAIDYVFTQLLLATNPMLSEVR